MAVDLGSISGPAVRNTAPDASDYGLVVRVLGGGGGGVVTQGTIPWICSDPILEASIDVLLSSRASEATLLTLTAIVNAGLDVALSTRASEATLATRASEATLLTLATEATVSTLATEATLLTRASEATLATRASEVTVATLLTEATFTARINTLGQKLMAASTPVVIASDQGPIPITPSSTNSTLANGAETAVSAVAVQVLAANASRKTAVIQNTGTENIRVGVVGVTAVTGIRLVPDASLILEEPFVYAGAIYAIREGASDSVALATEAV